MRKPGLSAPASFLFYFLGDLGPVPVFVDSLIFPPLPCEGTDFGVLGFGVFGFGLFVFAIIFIF